MKFDRRTMMLPNFVYAHIQRRQETKDRQACTDRRPGKGDTTDRPLRKRSREESDRGREREREMDEDRTIILYYYRLS